MQEVRNFFAGIKDGKEQYEPLEAQINGFLKEHPQYSARSIDVLTGPLYREAFVLFDLREEKKPANGKSNGRS